MSVRGIPWVALLPYLAAGILVALEWGLLTPVPAHGDHFQFWAAGQIEATGRSVYDRQAWVDMAAWGDLPGGVAANTVITNLLLAEDYWLYPPQTALLLAPLGALPLGPGIAVLHLLIVGSALVAAAAAFRAIGLSGGTLAVALVLAVMSEPVVMSARAGHPTGLVLLGCVLIFLGLRDGGWWQIVAGLPLATLKPQLIVAFAAACVVYVVWTRNARAVAAAAAGILLVIVPAVRDPFPLGRLFVGAGERAGFEVASTAAFARQFADGPALAWILMAFAAATAVVAIGRARGSTRPAIAFAAVLALSLAITPYAHEYDQLLLLPAAAVALVGVAAPWRHPLRVLAAIGIVVVVPYALLFWWDLAGAPARGDRAAMMGILPLVTLLAAAVVPPVPVERPFALRGAALGSP